MIEFTNINKEEISKLIKEDFFKPLVAVKNIPIKATELTQEKIDLITRSGGYKTVAINENGELFVETINKNENYLKIGNFLVTQIIQGFENSYIVPALKFNHLYMKTENEGVFLPIAQKKQVFMIPEGHNFSFEPPWGGEIKIRSGGVIVPDGDGFYGINPEEFKATYSVEEYDNKNRLKSISA